MKTEKEILSRKKFLEEFLEDEQVSEEKLIAGKQRVKLREKINKLKTDSVRAYIFGFSIMALAMFLGYIWSPNYFEFVNNGYNFLYVLGFGIILFITTWLIDEYYNTKFKNRDKRWLKKRHGANVEIYKFR